MEKEPNESKQRTHLEVYKLLEVMKENGLSREVQMAISAQVIRIVDAALIQHNDFALQAIRQEFLGKE